MADLIYVAIIVAFFALAALFVVGCDRIIGSDEAALAQTLPAAEPTENAELAA